MKQIIAIVQPHRLEAIEEALHALERLPGFTIFPAHGHPRGQDLHHAYAATEWNPDAHSQTVLLMFCEDALAPRVVETIRVIAHTGHPGDGLIAVSAVEDIVSIRNSERGDAAL